MRATIALVLFILSSYLLKLGIEVAQSTVAKYMAKRRPSGSGQTWQTFLAQSRSWDRRHGLPRGADDRL